MLIIEVLFCYYLFFLLEHFLCECEIEFIQKYVRMSIHIICIPSLQVRYDIGSTVKKHHDRKLFYVFYNSTCNITIEMLHCVFQLTLDWPNRREVIVVK